MPTRGMLIRGNDLNRYDFSAQIVPRGKCKTIPEAPKGGLSTPTTQVW